MPLTRPAVFAVFAAPGLVSLLPAQTDWTLLQPATSPLPFTAHAMAYHLATDRTVLFGGVHAGVRYNETWLWDGVTWTQASPANVPIARVAHAMAYDALRARIVMFGGVPAGGGTLGDTWEWDGIDWTLALTSSAPAPRWGHAMAWSPPLGKVVLFGGYAGGNLGDTWTWDGAAWVQVAPATSPTPRRAMDMAFDPVTSRVLLFSGYQQANDTWLFDGTNWTQQAPATSPPARYDHSLITDAARERIVLFGTQAASDTWEWNGSTWISRTPATLPTQRYDTYLAYDLAHEEVVMFGSVATPETWRYAPTHVARFTTSGSGCAGTLAAVPSLQSDDRPWLAETFDVRIEPVPANTIALMLLGLSDTVSGLGPLPLPLAVLGMPGCTLQVDPVLVDAFLAAGTTATWSLPIPNDTALLGAQLFCQGAAFDAGANPFGLIVADHGAMLLGGK
jgi:hypothetical protein